MRSARLETAAADIDDPLIAVIALVSPFLSSGVQHRQPPVPPEFALPSLRALRKEMRTWSEQKGQGKTSRPG
jgi:hypothetical protein